MGLFDRFTKKGKPEKTEKSTPNNGAFEIDYNDKFLSQLVRAGYQKERNESEDRIIDRWFQDICRNVLMENYEQWEADPKMRPRPNEVKRDDGRSEVG